VLQTRHAAPDESWLTEMPPNKRPPAALCPNRLAHPSLA
jgi:hypothetical protein